MGFDQLDTCETHYRNNEATINKSYKGSLWLYTITCRLKHSISEGKIINKTLTLYFPNVPF